MTSGAYMRLSYFQGGLPHIQHKCWTLPCHPCRKRSWVILVLLGALVFSVCATPVLEAQAVYGGIFGDVRDPSGRMVSDVEITVISVERGTEARTQTNERGGFDLAHLLPGTYRLRAAYPGLKTTEIVDIPVHVDEESRVDLRLEIGAVSERVEVSAEKGVPLLKTDRADVSVTFDQRVILDVPLPVKGNFTALELLAPGASLLGWQHASSENPQAGLQIDVNGQNWSGTSYQLDGTDNRDPILGIIVINPNPEAVTEVKITTQNFDAEFGQAVAGVVSTQTKSGTNEAHGSVAPSHEGGSSPVPDFLRVPGVHLPVDNQWSFTASLGGPIRKDHIFAFGDYAGDRLDRGTGGLFDVPTERLRQTCLDSAVAFCDLSEYPQQIWDPATGNTVPFSNNQIPRDRISPQAVHLLSLLPAPNIPEAPFYQNYLGSGLDILNSDRFDVRVDHVLSQNFQYFGRYSFADFRRRAAPAYGEVAGGPGMLDGFPGQALARNQSLALGLNFAWKDKVLIDFRFGFFRYRVKDVSSDYGTTPAKDAGIPNLNFDHDFTSGLPFLGVAGREGGNFSFGSVCNCPLFENEQQFQWVTNLARKHNRHMLMWGADLRYAENLRIPSFPQRAGGLNFGASSTQGLGQAGGGLGLATMLLGYVSSFGRMVSTTTDAGERQKRWYFYGQDTWRITPKLALNYGLRWEIYFPQSVTGKGRGGWLDFGTGEIQVAGYDHINLQGNVHLNLTNLAPRMALAYAFTPKTVVRLGYGRTFDLGVFGTTFGHTVTENLPVLATQEILPDTPTATVFRLSDGPPQPIAIVVPQSGRFRLPDAVSAYALPDKMRLPTVDQWNLTVQRALTSTLSLEVGYVGNKGTHVFPGDGPFYDLNQPSIVGFGTLSTSERRPFYKKFGWAQEITYSGSDASNNYNAMQVQLEKRMSNGYEIQGNYTWSRALNYDQDYYAIDPKVNHGLANTNRKHVLNLINVFDLPFGHKQRFLKNVKRWQDWIVGGWTLASNTGITSGLPFTPAYLNCGGVDIDTGPCRPNRVGKVHINGTREEYFTSTHGVPLAPYGTPGDTIGPWQRPATGTFGNVSRNSFYGPGYWQTNLDVKKGFHVGENATLEIRTWISNLFSTVNLYQPIVCVDCVNGGKIVGAGPGRSVGYNLRFQF
jgi:hypothetical protein